MSLKSNIYIQRCFDLARLGMENVSPNPMVGAVIATPNKILGEGYHKQYGQAHAEVVSVNDAQQKNNNNFKNATLFVSLEPCNFHGKTPPCTQLIIDQDIQNIVVSAIDKTDKVNFSGIQRLIDHGHQVEHGVLSEKGAFLARIRNTFVTRQRPYIILKYAQSQDGFMGQEEKQIWLSNAYTNKLVHKWRAEVQAIIVGKNTVLTDDPRLTTRLYPGSSPLRVSIDPQGHIPESALIKDGEVLSWIYTDQASRQDMPYIRKPIVDKTQVLQQICADLFQSNRDTLLVEGGPRLLQSFINAGLWDEARIITSPKNLHSGLAAPTLSGVKIAQYQMHNDQIGLYLSPKNVIYS